MVLPSQRVLFTEQTKNLETVTRLMHRHIHINVYQYVNQLIVVFGSTYNSPGLPYWPKQRQVCKKEFLLLHVLLLETIFFEITTLFWPKCALQMFTGFYGVFCKYYRLSPQHTQFFPLRSKGFLCDSYSLFL